MTTRRNEAPTTVRAPKPEPTLNLTKDAQLEQVRSMLVGPEQAALADIRERLTQIEPLLSRVTDIEDVLVEQFEMLTARLDRVEEILLATDGRTSAVAEVLVDAVSTSEREPGVLGQALAPEVEHAVHASARLDSAVLAEALYPVMGPALRKMIGDLFSMNGALKGTPFAVQQILVIERHTGLLLVSLDADGTASEESIVVSGMLDAVQHFVQDAFGASTHDGLQDLRVGDTSVLVEWGPQAALASVVTGMPTAEYRRHAAETLESFHEAFSDELAAFDGDNRLFVEAEQYLAALFDGRGERAVARSSIWPAVAALLLAAALIAFLFLGL